MCHFKSTSVLTTMNMQINWKLKMAISSCRKIGGRRYNGARRRDRQAPALSTTATVMLGLATMASVVSPIAAASLHPFTSRGMPRQSSFPNRRQRRANGERNVRLSTRVPVVNQHTLDIIPLNCNWSDRDVWEFTKTKAYLEPPNPDSPETTAAKAYDPNSYVPGSLIHVACECHTALW